MANEMSQFILSLSFIDSWPKALVAIAALLVFGWLVSAFLKYLMP